MKLLEEKINTAISLKNILFATDFSEVSEAALPYVAAMSLRYGGMVHVAHVLPEINLVRPSAIDPVTIGSIYEDAHSGAQEKIQEVSVRLGSFPHRTYIRHGKVSEVLSEIIREHEIDLLVAGTHGRTAIGKLLLGSVAEEVFRTATCPVLTIGPKVPKWTSSPHGGNREIPAADVEFRQILYATDFTPHSFAAASYAFSLAEEFRARLMLLHVIEEYGENLQDRPGPIDAALRKLEGLEPEHADLRWAPEPMVEFGSPADRILQTAAERDADLIVLGARPGHIDAAIHLPWATAHKVVAQANCPVLTVRQ
ncbi:MAG TPA: universal stress protein [Terriglobales bacterium]|nr:universal stress protein [Terriglobales bacterium]